MRKVCLVLFLVFGILALWIFFPIIFKYWVLHVLVTPPFTPEVFASLGPIGDIFGGLTALFTSATLIIVMYSAYLQRQANEDARKAMAEQLQQARDATALQLREARRSSDLQIEQARESTKQQLLLAQASHDAQLKESKYAIFANGFNTLLNYKHERYMSIQTTKESRTYLAHEIFTHLNIATRRHVNIEWKDLSKIGVEQVENDYYSTMNEISNIRNHTDIMGYFSTVNDLYNYINRSSINEDDKKFYKSIVLNSMSPGEQAALFWIGAFKEELNKLTRNENCFAFNYHEDMMPFAMKFYEKECFDTEFQEKWDSYVKKQNPA